MRKKWYFPEKMEISFTNRRWTKQICWRRSGTENIHLDTAATNSRRKSKGFSWRIRRVSSSTTSRLSSGCRWSDKWFLVHVRKRHKPPSHWTPSQTLFAERRIIPCSSEVHWRLQNYSYSSKRSASMIIGISMGLETRPILGQVLHYSVVRKTSRRIYVVRGGINEKAAYIQARSSIARALEINGIARQAEGEAEVRKSSIWRTHENYEVRYLKKPSRMPVRSWKHQWLLPCPCKIMKKCGSDGSNKTTNKTSVYSGSWWIYEKCEWEIRYRIIMKTMLQEKETIHYSIKKWFTNKFLRKSHEDSSGKSNSGQEWEDPFVRPV